MQNHDLVFSMIITKTPQREKKTPNIILPTDDKSKSQDICLDTDINIYQNMKCCYIYKRILIH